MSVFVAGNMMTSSPNVPALFPGTCDYVTFNSKRDFVNVMKYLEMGNGKLSWIIPMDLR